MSEQRPVSRSEVFSLLSHYRITNDGQVTDEMVTAWLRELRDYGVGECHAALASIPTQRVHRVTATEVANLIDTARLRPAGAGMPGSARPPLPRDPADRARDQAARIATGRRGIRAVYAAMGWPHYPDHDLAKTVRCPFCRAQRGQVCGPLVRDLKGRREVRDPKTRMHPSRLAAARADQATSTEQGASA